ncbi:DUF7344 domain-containing protein [Halorussus amylolyticus]|uniref:DUF7344 domain-containing protein n=1 Tax=Halorussus amylolyticus TaxID=1126242 RepID=UPI00192F8BD0|nr:hypothetical protein [Halorussus amylolyticus]
MTERHFDTLADATRSGAEGGGRLDTVFAAAADRDCRVLLRSLVRNPDDEVAVATLADCIESAGRDSDRDADQIAARLHHTVLPKLDDTGFLDYDSDCETVRYRSDATLETVLATVESDLDDAGDGADPPFSVTGLFDALADQRRRHALVTMLAHGDLPLPDLADEVAVAERDVPLSDIDPETVLEVYLSLYHTHVPKLADVGLATYDQERDFVALTDAGSSLEPTLRSLADLD